MVKRNIMIHIHEHTSALPQFDYRHNFRNNFFLLIADVHKHQYHVRTMDNNCLYVIRMCQTAITE